ncbi:uncharacterized protein Pyn_11256 [Prunus yedoensis var. nudiflora]|uniref:Uncharacterized protein n=1 Tax=Prunus yedoensis var. nudiflora TaxID=2094558 RepID=A0A314YFJ7_PRUYE|nr:uncharacterized protein Pyn_11256 [Prunus yedoensis var. nudiflora]
MMVSKASVNSVDVTKVDTDTALNGMGKERRTENIDNNQLSSTQSFRTSYEPKCDDIDISGNDDKTISFGSGHAMPDVDAMEISEHVITTRNCSNVPAQDGKSCIALSNAKNPTCSLDELCQEKSFQRNVSIPFVKQDIGSAKTGMVYPSGSASIYALVNNVNNTSSSSMEELKKEEVKRSWNNEVLLAFDSSHGGPGANSLKSTGHEEVQTFPCSFRE